MVALRRKTFSEWQWSLGSDSGSTYGIPKWVIFGLVFIRTYKENYELDPFSLFFSTVA